MDDFPENDQLADLSRKYSDGLISRSEFCDRRRKLLDKIDAAYNRRQSFALDMAIGIKAKFEDVLNTLKSRL